MRALVVAILLLAGCSDTTEPVDALQDGTGVIRGVVVDDSVTPVADATVLLDTGDVAQTDAEGLFRFDGVEPGTHFLEVDKRGYEATQVSTVVEADVALPDLLNILLAQAPSELPLAVPAKHTGFIACEALIGSFLQPCDGGTGFFGEPDNEIFLGGEDRAPTVVQAEVVWEHTQEFGARITMSLGSCNGGEYCSPFGGNRLCQNWGPSPIWCRVGQESVTASGHHEYGQTLNQTGHGRNQQGVGVGMHLGADCSVCADPVAPSVGVGIIVQQEVNAYLWSFYNMEPEEGWLFAVHGDP